ncbi:Protein EXPORTIN 1A [Camellia lanceoleosa]|uniref:Protein EXPORTIN 1A n=1 Tax=Camellia lanceoleosa TaxID=1840588 RepID=A0ACC0F6V5_9ERIC|nr:Protein EXPORTIN 1A [Camellia lanceoleosa]
MVEGDGGVAMMAMVGVDGSTAMMEVMGDGREEHIACANGTGPVDSAYKAIDHIVKVTQFVSGLFESRNDLSTFKNHIHDFLVQSKEFSAQPLQPLTKGTRVLPKSLFSPLPKDSEPPDPRIKNGERRRLEERSGRTPEAHQPGGFIDRTRERSSSPRRLRMVDKTNSAKNLAKLGQQSRISISLDLDGFNEIGGG